MYDYGAVMQRLNHLVQTGKIDAEFSFAFSFDDEKWKCTLRPKSGLGFESGLYKKKDHAKAEAIGMFLKHNGEAVDPIRYTRQEQTLVSAAPSPISGDESPFAPRMSTVDREEALAVFCRERGATLCIDALHVAGIGSVTVVLESNDGIWRLQPFSPGARIVALFVPAGYEKARQVAVSAAWDVIGTGVGDR